MHQALELKKKKKGQKRIYVKMQTQSKQSYSSFISIHVEMMRFMKKKKVVKKKDKKDT